MPSRFTAGSVNEGVDKAAIPYYEERYGGHHSLTVRRRT